MFGIDPATVGGGPVQTRLPMMGDGEGWFEAANWVLAAREAKDRFVMITLGACYGAQAVGSYRILQQLNPMPVQAWSHGRAGPRKSRVGRASFPR